MKDFEKRGIVACPGSYLGERTLSLDSSLELAGHRGVLQHDRGTLSHELYPITTRGERR